ncbi:MAG: hypothetical protein R3D98_00380 [Candidatus Krumholzibacteriia bacterium]
MSNLQKSAWFGLSVAIATVLACLVLLALFGPLVATAGFSVYALTALMPFLYGGGPVDERERLVSRRAGLAGGMASYLWLCLICMLLWFLRYRDADPRIDVNVLPAIVAGAAIALLLVRSLTVLILVGRPLEVGE